MRLGPAPTRARLVGGASWAAAAVAAASWLVSADAVAAPRFSQGPVIESDNGAALLEWEHADDETEYQVERIRDSGSAVVVYSGPMPSAHVSGLRQGEHQFRVRARTEAGWSDWSPAVVVAVEHHPMALVWTLFGLGAAVFLATGGFVLRQVREADD